MSRWDIAYHKYHKKFKNHTCSICLEKFKDNCGKNKLNIDKCYEYGKAGQFGPGFTIKNIWK